MKDRITKKESKSQHRCYCYYISPLLFVALLLMIINLCTAEAFVPRNPTKAPFFKDVRGGKSVEWSRSPSSSSSSMNRNEPFGQTKKYGASLKEFLRDTESDESLHSITGAAEQPLRNNGTDHNRSSQQSIKHVRVSSKGGMGATRMPPRSKNIDGNVKSNGYVLKNVSFVYGTNNRSISQSSDKLESFFDEPILAEFIAETALPTDVGQFRLRAYRTAFDGNEYTGREPSVIYAADKSPFGVDGNLRHDVPIRIHDQCLTSEVFGSRRCDCSQQLKMALKYVAKNGGAVIYLQQEGRGIGLANKVAAYALQDVGLDTVDANLHLGFPEDCRAYGAVPSILDDMKIASIRLMTNNPRKVHRLEELDVTVSNTVPMVVPTTNPYNHRYLEAKHERMHHLNLKPLFTEGEDDRIEKIPDAVIGETFVTEGRELAANAIKVSLALSDDDYEGVSMEADGYCFGRKSVEAAVSAINKGKIVVVVDDMNRENEGDLIMAADACTPEDMAFIVRYSSGVICIAMDGERMDKLGLPPMMANNEDPKKTAFTVTVDATKVHGITTGISSCDRAKTVNLLASANAESADFSRPGHIFPLRARNGGVLERDGHTEAAVDLSSLAGRARAGILCEIVSEDNPIEMMRLPELKRFCRQHGLILTSIVDLAQYRKDTEEEYEKTETTTRRKPQ